MYANGDAVDLVDPSGLMATEYGLLTKIKQSAAPAVIRVGRVLACEFAFTIAMIRCASISPNPEDPEAEACIFEAFAEYIMCKGGSIPPPGGGWN
jgi:hypothetical protein